jgi:hypothetical protein
MIKKICPLILITIIPLLSLAETRKILISEFMAINSETLLDEDGESSDWLELYNPGETAVNMEGWYLTDKQDNLTKWKIPDITLQADQYLVIFCSEKKRTDPSNNLHTNFKLSGTGEFLALVEPDGTTLSYSYGDVYPAQRQDISYGIYHEQLVFFSEPTPGAENILGDLPVAPLFSHTRGFYDSEFTVSLSSPGENVEIYYTTNGTRPTKQTGTKYRDAIPISTTTPLSAVAYNSSGIASEIITQTYLFIEDIVQQSNNPEGYPSTWSPLRFSSGNAPADYEMDPEICNHPEYKDLMDDALLSLPTLSVVTNIGYLFSHEQDQVNGGIYIYTGKTGEGGMGDGWERPASVEFFDPASHKEFQVNCGLRIHGGNSRVPENSQKHSFRISFRSQYGPSKLRFRFFDEEAAANEFNALVLRAGYNYSWVKNDASQRNNAQYLQDPFAKATQLALGHPSAHQRFVHLYLNGLYWGVYNVSEKLTNDFMESYLNGEEDDFDVIKDHGGIVDGSWAAWTRLYNQTKSGLSANIAYQKVQGKNPDGTLNPSLENLLDVENLIDYMQYNMYIGNEDWDHNNWIAARNRITNDAGFRFFAWDAETSMTDVHYNNVDENNEENPSWFYQKLQGNGDFQMLFADHIQQNFFNHGPLSREAATDRYLNLANQIDLAIIAESARWGDYRKDVAPSDGNRILYTRNDHWVPKLQSLLTNYFPYRTDIVVEQFRQIGLFPAIEAPAFSHYGGEMQSDINLTMTTNYGDIYFTTDGTDPRKPITSTIASGAQLYSEEMLLSSNVTVKARAKSGNEWSPLTQATFDFATSTEEFAENRSITAGCYPNPFHETTNIMFDLPSDGEITIDLYRIDGKKIALLFSGFKPRGYNEIKWTPEQNEPGIFLYRIHYNNQIVTGKIVRK